MTYDLSAGWTIVLIIGVTWELIWKGTAMWRAAQLDQPVWFTLLLVISSLGILPLIYLLLHHEYGHGFGRSRGCYEWLVPTNKKFIVHVRDKKVIGSKTY